MAVAPFNPNEAVPADSDIVSQFPAVERDFRDIMEDWVASGIDPTTGAVYIDVDTTVNLDALTTVPVGTIQYDTTLSEFRVKTATGPAVFAHIPSYTKGTFTPVLNFNGVDTGITYATNEGVYTRIGDICYFGFVIVLTSKGSATGDAFIDGFPFDVSPEMTMITHFQTIADFTSTLQDASTFGRMDSNFAQGNMGIFGQHDGEAFTLDDSDFTNVSAMRASGFYFIA